RGLAALLVALAAQGCTDSLSTATSRPSAILITLDTTRADALAPYGAPNYVSPFLDAFASECVRYTNARSVAPLTLPAHASMLTGLYPPRHGVRDNGLCPLPASALTVAELAQAEHVQTAAFVSALVLDRTFALDQGFDVYDQPPRPAQQTTSHYVERSAVETLQAARKWLAARDESRPFFVWIHLYEPHVPYAPPKRFLDQAHGDPYRGEIACADSALGLFLEDLEHRGRLDDTFVALTSDHGESLGEHGEPTHGAYCYDATMRVPLLLRYPRALHRSEVADELVTLADVAPTLCSALQLPPLPGTDGESLYEHRPARERGVYCESYSGFLNYGWSPLCGWIAPAGKYLHSSAPEFYDLARDAHEKHDLFPEPRAAVSAARDAIGRMSARPGLTLAGEATEISGALLRDLRQLGYGASGTRQATLPLPLEAGDGPSPKDGADELEPLLIANALIDARNFAEAAPILARIVAANPRHVLALDLQGFALLQLGQHDAAREAFAARAKLGLPRADTLVNWGIACEHTERADEARAHFERALGLDSTCVQALEGLARLADARHDEATARKAREQLRALREPTREPGEH
ncbi:MAG TPA: sulfatase-like hydrolase/transferase, partial [Planctomycetota bacterium]|nr:sulfatase-like hydrolase/transferase [Planctomycetota bacterium]